MIIPKLHYISQGNSPKEHLENIQKACTSGSELVQLRLKNISEKKCLKLAKEAREITAHFQTRLIINDYYKIAKEVKADGAHLGKTDCCPTEEKEKRKYKIFKSKNVTNSVAGELSFLFLYAQKVNSNKTREKKSRARNRFGE